VAEPDVIEAADPRDVRNAPPPPYVVTRADRERWELAGKIAEAVWEANAPGERLDPSFYWQMQRTVYSSDIPTGSPADVEEAEVSGSGETGPEVDPQALWADVEKQKPGKGASVEEHWAHIGRICDVFDKLFGNPDDYHLGEYEGALALPEKRVEEFGFSGIHVPYNADLHPRDRLGKWVQKLGGIHAAAMDRSLKLRQGVAGVVAANRMGHAIRNPLHDHPEAVSMAGHGSRIERVTRDFSGADEERAREGVHGAVQRLRAGTTRAHNAVIANLGLALMKAEEIEHEDRPKPHQSHVAHVAHKTLHTAIPAHQAPTEQMAGTESVERTMHLSDLATEAGRWATEHESELRMIGHVLSQTGRAFGIAAADVTVEDEQDARAILESLTD
jgi:hypothetical protein